MPQNNNQTQTQTQAQTQTQTSTQPRSTQTLSSNEEVLALVDQVFLLPHHTKDELKEVFPNMPEEEKKEFVTYIKSILKKQDEILSYLVKNNPQFISDLKDFNRSMESKTLKDTEAEIKGKEDMDMKALEESLKKI